MIESIALALAKTLATYLFKTYVLMTSNIKIEGAPHWYMQNVSSSVCVYDFKTGDISSVDEAKDSVKKKMEAELTSILQAVIYDNYRNLTDEKEKAFVNAFANDKEADIFIGKSIRFQNIEYIKKQRTAYVQGCIDKQVILDYQNERIGKIKYSLTHLRADNAFDELDKGDTEFK